MADAESLRTTVKRALRARVPVDRREAESLATCERLLCDLPAPFDRASGPVHVTGSGIVTSERGVLLLLHRRLDIWVQPGGHLEAGETPSEAARRECEEETGLTLVADRGASGDDPAGRLVHVDVHPSAGGHTHLDLRYGFVVAGDLQPRPPAGESQDVRWYPWPEAVAVADPGLAALLSSLTPPGVASVRVGPV